MAGKKGMKHRRPRTQQEKDIYALGRIEYIIDSLGEDYVTCPDCKKDHKPIELSSTAAQLLRARYDKLRPTLSSQEITDKREGWIDLMKRLAEKKSVASEQQTQVIAVQHDESVTEEPTRH